MRNFEKRKVKGGGSFETSCSIPLPPTQSKNPKSEDGTSGLGRGGGEGLGLQKLNIFQCFCQNKIRKF